MSAVCKCEMCLQIDETVEPESEYCTRCTKIVSDIKLKASSESYKEHKERFGEIVSSRVWVLNCMESLFNEKPTEFKSYFGTIGMDILRKANETTD